MNSTPLFPSPAEYVAKCRAVLKPGEYFIEPQDSRCGWNHLNIKNTDLHVLVTPKQGSDYLLYELLMKPDGSSIEPFNDDMESFLFVIEGNIKIKVGSVSHELEPGGYAWAPPPQPLEFSENRKQAARVLWFRRPYQTIRALPAPDAIFGNEKDVTAIAEVDLNPEKQLIPYENPAFDIAFNLIVVPPGGYYGLVEMHAWEHAMYMLDGEGLLYLNGQFHQVKENDFIYIAPYCPEFFCALGMDGKPVRFLLYWDWNREYNTGFGLYRK